MHIVVKASTKAKLIERSERGHTFDSLCAKETETKAKVGRVESDEQVKHLLSFLSLDSG